VLLYIAVEMISAVCARGYI